MSSKQRATLYRLLAGVGIAGAMAAGAGQREWNFNTDPLLDPDLQFGWVANDMPWVDSGGNPGGFLALTWPVGNLYTGVIFPDIDPGKIVTAFTFECDLRVGNSSTDRPADGFSISFARDGDPVLADIFNSAAFAGGVPEAGTTTGIAISFDTWSGN